MEGRPPGTELNFKFYRQATNKIAGVSDATTQWLDGFFQPEVDLNGDSGH